MTGVDSAGQSRHKSGCDTQKGNAMPRDSRVPRLDAADNDDLHALGKLLARLSRRRARKDATYEERRRADLSVMADALWLREDEELLAHVTRAERVVVDDVVYKRMDQPSSTTYHGLWGTHVIEEPLYRRADVRNGPTIKPLALDVGAVGNPLPDAGRVFALLRSSMTSVDIERILFEMGYRPPGRAYIEKRVKRIAHEMDERVVELEDAARNAEVGLPAVAAVSCGLDRMAVRMEELLPEGTEREDRPRRKKPYQRTPPPPAEHNWRMAWVGSMTEYDEHGEPIRTRRYGTDAGASRDEISDRVIADVKATLRRSPGIPVVSIQDGAKELASLPAGLDAAMSDDDLAVLPGKLGADVVAQSEVLHLTDFHHAVSYLDEVVRLCEPACDPRNMREYFRSVLLHDDDGVETVLRHLRRRAANLERGAKRTAVKKAIGYIHKRRTTMRYARAVERGLAVGSGATESTCSLFQLSVKRPGASWSVPGLRGVMTLRGLALSDRWGPAWETYAGAHRRRVTRVRALHRAPPHPNSPKRAAA
jgi:hypothetical protein